MCQKHASHLTPDDSGPSAHETGQADSTPSAASTVAYISNNHLITHSVPSTFCDCKIEHTSIVLDASSTLENASGGTPAASNPDLATTKKCSASASYPSSQKSFVSNMSTAQLSTFRLLLAHTGAALTLFLATTDATIISTALPTITSDLGATNTQYTWVGVAYMLTQTAFQPLYGRISDIVGRKSLLYMSITIFAIGSLLCGVAQTINMLIASRALAGIGGGGIVSCVWVITSEIVEVRHRAKWSQALSVTWSCSAIAGPLLGGIFSGSRSSSISWRWCFYLNLPVCLVGFLVLSFSLRGIQLQQTSDSLHSIVKRFDFGGLIFFVGGTCCLVVGFSFATNIGWGAPATIILILLGLAILGSGAVYEVHTTRDSLFPPAMFRNLAAVTILVVNFLHNFTFNAGTFYLALYYQAANGYTPLEAGVRMLPYSLGSSLASMPAAWVIGYWQKRSQDTSGQNWVISIGFLISTLGFGLLNLLDEKSSQTSQIIFPLVAGIGLGMLFHAPYQVFVKALKPSELATGTSAFFLVRFTGATIGIAVAGAVFDARVSARMPSNLPVQLSGSSFDFSQLETIYPLSLRNEILHIISTAIQTVWIVCTPLLGIAFIMSFLLRKLPIEDMKSPANDDEKTLKEATQSSAEPGV